MAAPALVAGASRAAMNALRSPQGQQLVSELGSFLSGKLSSLSGNYPELTNQLVAATGGRVDDVAQVQQFIKTDAGKAKVVLEAAAVAGVPVNQLFPVGMVNANESMRYLSDSVEKLSLNMQKRFDRGSDSSLNQGPQGIAADVIRRQRVEAVLSVYRSKDAYFLCHPMGGVPAEDFVWYETVILGRS